MTRCRLYLITPPALPDLDGFAASLKIALDAGDVASLQIRLKDVPDTEVSRAVATLMPLCHAHEVAVILNDRPDLAVALGCDGAHVGQEDMPLPEARQILGPDRTLGATCHNSRHLAMEAGEAGADYVAFGAFFPTTTKDARTRASADVLTWWNEVFALPCVAIGGLTVDNCRPIVAAGADFLAVSAGVWQFPSGPAAAVRAFNRIFDELAH